MEEIMNLQQSHLLCGFQYEKTNKVGKSSCLRKSKGTGYLSSATGLVAMGLVTRAHMV